MGDHDNAIGIAGLDDVAGVDLAQANAPADRRRDARIAELQLRIVDHALVGLDHAFVLAHQRLLGVELLLGDRVLLEQCAIAFEVDLRVGQLRLVARHLALGLGQLHLEGARIDLGQQFAGLDHLALFEQDAHQLSIDPAAHRHGSEWHGRAQAIEEHADVAGARCRCNHRRQRPVAATARRAALAAARAAFGRLTVLRRTGSVGGIGRLA